MGGRAFKTVKGLPLSVGILRSEIGPTLSGFFLKVLSSVSIGKIRVLGSAGKKSISNDIDISIGPACGSTDCKTYKSNLLIALKSLIGDEHVKLLGQNISINYPIASLDVERQALRVQIDVIISKDPDLTAWLMAGTREGEIKGMYRNMLLSYIANVRSIDGRRITISYPGGVQVEEGGIIVNPRNEIRRDIQSPWHPRTSGRSR